MKCGNETVELSCSETDETLTRELLEIQLSYTRQLSQLAEIIASSGEYSILYYLFRDSKCYSAGELSGLVGLSPGRVANVLKALEKKHFIVRKRDTEDKRKTMVTLTPEGAVKICSCYTQIENMYRKLVEKIGPEDVRNFIRIMKDLLAISKSIDSEN